MGIWTPDFSIRWLTVLCVLLFLYSYTMLKRIIEYFTHSSIHGLHYIIDSKRHISERIFWAVVCTSCLIGAGLVLRGNIYNYENNAVSFVVETNHLKWNTTFPAISVCEFESSDKLFDAGTKLYGEDRNMNLDFFLRDIAFYYGTCYTCSAHCGKTINCSQDFEDIVRQVRAPCNELLGECKFNGLQFKCCRYFRLLRTEKGPCYTINSLLLKKSKFPLYMTQNWKTGPGKLEFRAYEKVKVVLHAPEDVPFLNHPQQEQEIIPWGNIFDMRFQVKEIKNDPYVKKVSISQRNCRFPDENYLQTYSLYSYSACVVDCRAQAQIQYCNCLHHFMPKIAGVATCNLTGLICLSNVSDTLRSLRTADYTEKLGLVCDCLPSCNEPEYTIVSRTTGLNEEYNETIYGRFGSKISIEMDSLPKEQFIRKVVRSPLELVVSMGGTIGFFLGASLLSIAEFFYYFFIRKLVDRKRSSVLSHKPELTIKTNKSMKNKKSKNIKQERMAIPYIN